MKLFLSHACEDKKDFVDALAEELKKTHDVWYDTDKLLVGDRMLTTISKALKECDFGIVVLSKAFTTKKWTQAELEGLFALENTEHKLLLFVWKGITKDEVVNFVPFFADRFAANAADGVPQVTKQLNFAIDAATRNVPLKHSASIHSRISKAALDIRTRQHSGQLLSTVEGVRLIHDAFHKTFATVESEVKALPNELSFQFALHTGVRSFTPFIHIEAPFSLLCEMTVNNLANDSASLAFLRIAIRRARYDNFGTFLDCAVLIDEEYTPLINIDQQLLWLSDDKELLNERLPEYFLQLISIQIEKDTEAYKTASFKRQRRFS